jgi:type I restriction enzyme S subunit
VKEGRPKIGKVKSSDFLPYGQFPVVDQGQSFIAGYSNDPEGVYGGPLPVIVFGDHTRIFKYVDFPFLAGADGTQVLIPNDKRFDPRFLFFALSALQIPSRGYNRHFTILKQKSLPQPPLPEQKAIAQVLRTVQRAKEATEKVIAACRQLKQSLMRHLFTYGPVAFDQADKVALKETEIGEMPEHWGICELSQLLRQPLRNGHSARATNNDQGIRTLILTAITQDDFSLNNTKLTVADPNRVRDLWLENGDIFVERANTLEYVGLAALYEGPHGFAIFPDLLVRVRVDTQKIIPKLLAEFLLSPFCRDYYHRNAKSTAGSFPKIDHGTIEQTPIAVPSYDEQCRGVECFRAIDRKIESEEGRHQALTTLFNTLLHHLMTGKVRVV